jgi:hypothetical protein
MGYDQGFDKQYLREFLIEEAGLDDESIQNIVVENNRSRFDIPEKYERQVFINLKGMKINCRNFKLSLEYKAANKKF